MRMRGRSIQRALVVSAVVSLALSVLATAAGATSGTMYVDADTTLSEDHYGAIVIEADNVTLDCAGRSIIGSEDTNGVTVDGYSNVTVRNCHVEQSAYGIWMYNASGGLLENNEVSGNVFSGLDVVNSTDVVVRQNLMYGNGWGGIDVEYGSSNVEVIGNTGLGPAGGGFYTYDSTDLLFRDNTSYSGFSLDEGTTHSTFSHNDVVNGSRGFVVLGSHDNRFVGNVVSGNDGAGFGLFQSSRNFIGSNEITGNSEDGVLLASASGSNVIKNNEIRWNGYTGIALIEGSGRNVLSGNTTSRNGDSGVRIETSHNTVLASSANRNVNYGFWVLGNFNKLALNSGCGNGVLDALQASGTRGNVWRKNTFCTSTI